MHVTEKAHQNEDRFFPSFLVKKKGDHDTAEARVRYIVIIFICIAVCILYNDYKNKKDI